MSRFGDLLGGKKAEAPAPVEVTSSPIVEEDETKYEEVIEAELAEQEEEPAPAPEVGGGYYVPSATGTSPLSAG